MTVSKMTEDKMTADKMTADKMTAGKMTTNKMTADGITADKMPCCLFMFMTTHLGIVVVFQPYPTNSRLELKYFTGLNTLADYIDAKNSKGQCCKTFYGRNLRIF